MREQGTDPPVGDGSPVPPPLRRMTVQNCCRDEPCSSGSPQANNRPQGDPRHPVGRRDLPAANCIRAECRTSAACPYSMSWGIRCRDEPCSSGSPQANNRPQGDPRHPVGRRDLPAANCIRSECRKSNACPYRYGAGGNGCPFPCSFSPKNEPKKFFRFLENNACIFE